LIRRLPPRPDVGEKVSSPLTGRATKAVHAIACQDLVTAYAEKLGVDIGPYVGGISHIHLYRCPDSGFRFYQPASVLGDDAFYKALSAHDWYYPKKKWEFEESLRFLPSQGLLLEVGPGQGDFLDLSRIRFPKLQLTGLELNRQAAAAARSRGLDVREEDLAAHVDRAPAIYDVVCAFQVLEHIPDPLEFLRACCRLLRPGGRLLLAVPHNPEGGYDSLFAPLDDPLNLPPHHQGIWNADALIFLSRILPLRLVHLGWETVQDEAQLDLYARHLRAEFKTRHGLVFGRLRYLLGKANLRTALRCLTPFLPAHSLMAVFDKDLKEVDQRNLP